MKLNGKIVALLMVVSLLVGSGGMYAGLAYFSDSDANEITLPGTQDPEKRESAGSEQSFEKVRKTYQLISQNYFQDVDQSKLLNGAVQGMIKSLDDPYSVYMDPQTASRFTQSLSSSFEGIGAQVTMRNGKVTIISPIKGSPAEAAGLRPNDKIITIDGKGIEELNLQEAVLKIRGEKGTTVTLGVQRQGASDLLKIDVKRDVIPLKTVYPDTIEQNGKTFGYIEITSFSEGTAEDFGKALADFEEKGIDGLVIDVRGNPGGYLGAVTAIGSLIIPNKEIIVQTETRSGETKRYPSSLKGKKDYPIVGLIDGGSASASEILAGALKEAGGYPLVGVKSFGKGTVQQQWKLDDGSNVKLTVMKWLTPDSNWIHEKGVKPSHKIKQPDYFYTHPITVKEGEPLVYNNNNDQVQSAQEILSGLGFEPGRKDGYFSEQTKTAVEAFQRTNDLTVTGKINPKTASKLQQEIIKKIEQPENDLQLRTAVEVLLQNQNK